MAAVGESLLHGRYGRAAAALREGHCGRATTVWPLREGRREKTAAGGPPREGRFGRERKMTRCGRPSRTHSQTRWHMPVAKDF